MDSWAPVSISPYYMLRHPGKRSFAYKVGCDMVEMILFMELSSSMLLHSAEESSSISTSPMSFTHVLALFWACAARLLAAVAVSPEAPSNNPKNKLAGTSIFSSPMPFGLNLGKFPFVMSRLAAV